MIDDDPIEEEHQKEGEPEKSKGMDWESMVRDAFIMFMLAFFGFAAASILLHLFKPELNTMENAFQCGMAYMLLAYGFRIIKY